MKVAFHLETLDAAHLFRSRLNELGKKVDLGVARLYVMSGKKLSEVPEDIYEEIEEVFAIREKAIYAEMHAHGVAQAYYAGIELEQDILDGKSLSIGFPKLYDQVPTSKVYELFIPFTTDELKKQV